MTQLVCGHCARTFNKGEHLRRHERSHTGTKPFVCKDCNRAFARQDALLRHGRIHDRPTSDPPAREQAQQHQDRPSSSATLSFQSTEARVHDSNAVPEPSQQQSAVSAGTHARTDERSGLTQGSRPLQHHAQTEDQHAHPPLEMDFDLMWPDSEQLFQDILSTDYTNQWQMSFAPLPYPLDPQDLQSPSSESVVASSSAPNAESSTTESAQSGHNHRAVRDVSKMIANMSSDLASSIESTSISSMFLDECLHMFFVKFIPTFPILHRPTFVFGDCIHPLLLNAIAIGSLYLGPKESVVRGELLWRLAHTAVATSWQTLITRSGPYDACNGIQLVTAALLCQVYGLLSGNRSIRLICQPAHSLSFLWARQCGMFDVEPFGINDLPSSVDSFQVKDRAWRVWASREQQKRSVLALHMLDGLYGQMTGVSSSERHVNNQTTLPAGSKAFESDTADDWIMHTMGDNRRQPIERRSFRTMFRSLFSQAAAGPMRIGWPANHLGTFSAFSLKVILEGLQSLIGEQDDTGEHMFGIPSKPDIRRALARTYDCIMESKLALEDRLEVLLRWHAVSLETIVRCNVFCRSVCRKYNIEQHVWMTKKKRSQPISEVDASTMDLTRWPHAPEGRKALLHAVTIQDMIEQLPRGRAHAIHIPITLLAAATVYAVYSLAGIVTVRLPGSVDWPQVLHAGDSSCADLPELEEYLASPRYSQTIPFIRGERSPVPPSYSPSRNLLYELNSVDKLFRSLSTQWGVAHDMESLVAQWISMCHT